MRSSATQPGSFRKGIALVTQPGSTQHSDETQPVDAVATNAPSPPPPTGIVTTPPPLVANQNVIVTQPDAGPGLLARAIWFLFIGTWLSALSIGVAYFLCLSIIGLPLGFMIFNRLPLILTLRPRTDLQSVEVRDGVTYVSGGTVPQRPLWVRALWFVFIGWWFGALYLSFAWFLCVILITLPLGLYLFNRVGAVMTLLRY